MIEYRPACGSGSCARCRDALGLDAEKRGERWYCSRACAQGQPTAARAAPGVAESRLYHRPSRFFGKRHPKELRAAPHD
jgi:hypothetical protein